jgi:hypothetical protein
MKLHVALPDNTLVTTPRARTPVRKLTARRGDVLEVDVSFSRDGRPGSLPAGSTVALAVYAGPGSRTPLVFANNPTLLGRGTSSVYHFPAVSLALDSLGTSFASQRVVPLALEVRVTSGYSSFATAPVTLEVSQSALIAGATPPVLETVPSTPLYIREITALTGGGGTALDGVPTIGRDGLVVMCYVSGEMQTWRLFTGTDAENPSAGVVRPDDYHATSNQRVWKRVL